MLRRSSRGGAPGRIYTRNTHIDESPLLPTRAEVLAARAASAAPARADAIPLSRPELFVSDGRSIFCDETT